MGFLDILFGKKSSEPVPQSAANTKPSINITVPQSSTAAKSAIDITPDKPQPFGYKTSWLCIRAESSEEVISALGLKNAVHSNWKSGMSHRDKIFVSPVISGWVLVIGYDTFQGADAEVELVALAEIAKKFSEVQCFVTHRVVDFHTWAKLANGELVRAYGWFGESGVVYLNKGNITPEEQALGFDKFIQSDDDDWNSVQFPDEVSVIKIAAAWGVDPLFSDSRLYEYGVGYLCEE